jgi:hypothetical protein
VVSTTVGATGLPVAVYGQPLDLDDSFNYNETDRRLEVRVPMRLSCTQPAYAGSQKCRPTGTEGQTNGTTGGTGGTGATGATGGSVDSSRNDGIAAGDCLRASVTASDGLQFTSSCNATVHYLYCYTGAPSSLFSCSRPPASIGSGLQTYGQGSSSVGAGRSTLLPESSGAGVIWFGCIAGPSGVQPFAVISGLSPTTGGCR